MEDGYYICRTNGYWVVDLNNTRLLQINIEADDEEIGDKWAVLLTEMPEPGNIGKNSYICC